MWVNNSQGIFFLQLLRNSTYPHHSLPFSHKQASLYFSKHQLSLLRGFVSAVPSARNALPPGFTWWDCHSNVVSSERYFLTTTPSDLLWLDHYRVFSFSSLFLHVLSASHHPSKLQATWQQKLYFIYIVSPK